LLAFSSLFIVQFFNFFLGGGGPSGQGAMLFYPRGGRGNIMLCLVLTCWSAKCIQTSLGPASGSAAENSCFLSVTRRGEAFHGLGVQSVGILILLAALFPPKVAPACQWGFGVMDLMLSASVP
jgi:hypothetical protein